MPALAVNGVPVGVLDGSASLAVEEIGEKTRAFDGSMRSSRRATKRTLSIEVPMLVPADAEPIRQLLLGAGHAWSFEGQHLYSSKGKGPAAAVGTPTYGAGKFGSYALQTSNTVGVQYALGTAAWSVLAWHHDGTAWHHRVACSDGSGGLDGVAGSASVDPSHGLQVAGGLVQIGSYSAPAAGTYRTDDLVILPYVLPAAWVPAIFAAGAPWGGLPKLSVTGDLLSGIGPLAMIGEVGSTSYVQGYLDGTWYSNLHTVSATLTEA